MKKVFLSFLFLGYFLPIFSQAVKDRNVVPVGVSLNQVLRLSVTGEDVQFIFSDFIVGLNIGAKNALMDSTQYRNITNIKVSSSARWTLYYGSDKPFLVGENKSNTLALNNIGFSILNKGSNLFEKSGSPKGTTKESSLFSYPTNNGTEVSGLQMYPTKLIEDNNSRKANTGDDSDNSFTIFWECGTAKKGSIVPMNQVKLLDQKPNPAPDTYTTNVVYELVAN
jgi:hypothetical protein